MKILETRLPGVLLIEPEVFEDDRGYFLETWSNTRYEQIGIPRSFVQDNVSRSEYGTVRGLHLQHPHSQGKLVSVLGGEVYDVAVDVRVGSPHFGEWVGVRLSADNHHQLWVPPGFAHGFCVTSEHATLAYKCSEPYHPEAEVSVAWDDPRIAVSWPIRSPILSEKDRRAPRLEHIPVHHLPRCALE